MRQRPSDHLRKWPTTVWALMLLVMFATAQSAPSVPDLNGVWVIADSFMDKQDGTALGGAELYAPGTMKRPANPPKLKGDYAQRFAAVQADTARGVAFPDPTANCLPQGLTRFWQGPFAFEIVQTPKQINFYSEWLQQTHRVYLDGRRHPDDVDPSYNGHAIGQWRDGVLHIDVVALSADSLLTLNGATHGPRMRINERLRVLATDLIEIEQTIVDPDALDIPWVRTTQLRRKPGMEIQEYVCTENNRPVVESTTSSH